jgi:hypothetical protein
LGTGVLASQLLEARRKAKLRLEKNMSEAGAATDGDQKK